MGARIVRRDWLLSSPYDELLDAGGIGNDYGVVLHSPELPAIHVVTDLPAFHQKDQGNFLSEADSYFRRGLASHYFMHDSERFGLINRMLFVWSLCGNWIVFFVRGNRPHLRATSNLISAILNG